MGARGAQLPVECPTSISAQCPAGIRRGSVETQRRIELFVLKPQKGAPHEYRVQNARIQNSALAARTDQRPIDSSASMPSSVSLAARARSVSRRAISIFVR